MTRTGLAAVLALTIGASGALAEVAPGAAGEAAGILDAARAVAPAGPSANSIKITYAFSGLGLTGEATSLVDPRNGRFMDTLKAGPASQAQGFDGTKAWEEDSSGAVIPQDSAQAIALTRNDAYRRANLWWRADRAGATIEALGRRTDEKGAFYDAIAVTPKGGLKFEAWFDASHRLARILELQGALTVTTRYDDYHVVGGVALPWRMTVDDGSGAKYAQTYTVTSAVALGDTPGDAFAAPKAVLADFAIDGGKASTTIPFTQINNHIYALASVNGQPPMRFIFDTGGTELVTPAMAKVLGLKVQGDFDGHGAGEGIMSGGLARVDELAIGGARTKGELFAILPLDALSDVEGVEEQGMAGFQTFRRFVTRIDYPGRTITLIDPKAFNPDNAGTPIPFTYADVGVEIDGTFEGVKGRFSIDTGSRVELTLNRPFAERLRVRETHPHGVDAVDGWGVGGPSRAYVFRAKSMTLGGVEVTDLVADAATQTKGAFAGDNNQGNIGGGLLKRFVVTFDYPHQMLYLKPAPQPVADAGTFDRAGMWFNRAPGGLKVVDVTAGGPAEAAGLKPGDLITAVEGRPSVGVDLGALRVRLRNDPPGTRVALTLSRDGHETKGVIALKDLAL